MNKYIKYIVESFFDDIEDDLVDQDLTLLSKMYNNIIVNNSDNKLSINCKQYDTIPNKDTIIHIDDSIINISINMSGMFFGCNKLKSVDLRYFDTSNVTSMSNMFYECISLKSVDLSNIVTTNVKNMFDMFCGCKSLESLNLSNFDTSNVKTMSNMFYCCESLKYLNLNSWKTYSVVSISYMFYYCESLESLDLSNFDLSEVNDILGMFLGCKSLKYIKCRKEFRDWCMKYRNTIFLPSQMQNGKGIWDIID